LVFAGCYGHTTNINAEIRAISCGLQITWDIDFRDIDCESDSQANNFDF